MKIPFIKAKEEKKSASGTNIRVKVYRMVSDVTPALLYEFDAEEQRDENHNIVFVNDEMNFKEEAEIVRNRIIEFLSYKLQLNKKSKVDQLKEVDDKINKIEEEIKKKNEEIDKNMTEVNTVDAKEDDLGFLSNKNIIDYQNELKHYKQLRYFIENKGQGSYEIISKDNMREIHFTMVEGVLFPVFHRSPIDNDEKLTSYVDITAKRKFYKEASDRVTQDLLKSQNNVFSGVTGMIATIAIVALFIFAGILNIRANEKLENANLLIEEQVAPYREMANDNAVQCGYYYTKLIEDAMINKSINRSPTDTGTTDKGQTSGIVNTN